MAANKSRIVLGGKVFGLLRVRGDSHEVYPLLHTKDERWARPSAEEPQTMLEWFRFESGASDRYVKAYIANKETDVFFLIDKKTPIGFFSIAKRQGEASLGSMYIKREFRRGYGNLLVARALRIVRNSGFKGLIIPQMTDKMGIAATKAVEDAKTVKTHELQYEEAYAGPDMLIKLHERPNRRERRRIQLKIHL
ncbi:MAG: GNAT family N-acetyltransferase [Candidatus Diapherotrites archaeon]|nr:GNAT family N-acetyltransferase [Candidatus Diapherotrites archaeon]